MLSHPLTGLGVGSFPRAEGLYSAPVRAYEETARGRIKWSVAHNSFIEVGADLGIPGVVRVSELILGGIGAVVGMRRRLSWPWAFWDEEQRFIVPVEAYSSEDGGRRTGLRGYRGPPRPAAAGAAAQAGGGQLDPTTPSSGTARIG